MVSIRSKINNINKNNYIRNKNMVLKEVSPCWETSANIAFDMIKLSLHLIRYCIPWTDDLLQHIMLPCLTNLIPISTNFNICFHYSLQDWTERKIREEGHCHQFHHLQWWKDAQRHWAVLQHRDTGNAKQCSRLLVNDLSGIVKQRKQIWLFKTELIS